MLRHSPLTSRRLTLQLDRLNVISGVPKFQLGSKGTTILGVSAYISITHAIDTAVVNSVIFFLQGLGIFTLLSVQT